MDCKKKLCPYPKSKYIYSGPLRLDWWMGFCNKMSRKQEIGEQEKFRVSLSNASLRRREKNQWEEKVLFWLLILFQDSEILLIHYTPHHKPRQRQLRRGTYVTEEREKEREKKENKKIFLSHFYFYISLTFLICTLYSRSCRGATCARTNRNQEYKHHYILKGGNQKKIKGGVGKKSLLHRDMVIPTNDHGGLAPFPNRFDSLLFSFRIFPSLFSLPLKKLNGKTLKGRKKKVGRRGSETARDESTC